MLVVVEGVVVGGVALHLPEQLVDEHHLRLAPLLTDEPLGVAVDVAFQEIAVERR